MKSKIRFYNSLSEKKEDFIPINEQNIRMYVCGPTVYSRPHIGNIRSVIIYDVLYRLLKNFYSNVSYARNITDVDDKIINEAKNKGISESKLTKDIENQFHEDIEALFCLRPTYEPRATENIAEMIEIIDKIIENGYGYIAENHVLFNVNKYKNYGALSKRNIDELIAGARIDVESYKKNPYDFVLWKPAEKDEYGFESKYGYGRPGWHIECSAMSRKLFGDEFDIHGGGVDLKFPHHENEIAQSVCATGKNFAKYWIHNGFLTVNGEKMSKSLGNFITIRDLLDKGHNSEVIRFAFLFTNYSKPLDFTEKLLYDSKLALERFYKAFINREIDENEIIPENLLEVICDDLNTTKYIALMFQMIKDITYEKDLLKQNKMISQLYKAGKLIGIFNFNASDFLSSETAIPHEIITLAQKRIEAKKLKDFKKSDEIRHKILEIGYEIKDLTEDRFEIKKK